MVGYEAVLRLLHPVPISFGEAILIAVLGLLVNLVSAWLLSGGHGGGHGHRHGHVMPMTPMAAGTITMT